MILRRFVLGDLHGGYKALLQVLDRANFDKEHDQLILLGDLCDGWPETFECVELLRQLWYCVFVRGNHDQWLIDWIERGVKNPVWTPQGGAATQLSYAKGVPDTHRRFFRSSVDYYVQDNMLFVHGGLNPAYSPKLQDPEVLMWDRTLIHDAWRNMKLGQPKHYGDWKYIFLGHTSIAGRYDFDTPQIWGNVVAMDTGGGWEGPLSLMNIDTREVYQSDYVRELYPNAPGRYG